jgi:PAS domain S-box-containing protein
MPLQADSSLEALVRAYPDPCLIIDREGTFLDCLMGGSGGKALPVPPKRFLGRNVRDAFSPELSKRFLSSLKEVRSSRSLVSLEYVDTIDGELRHFEARFTPLPGDDALMVLRETTEHHATLKAIERERRVNSAVLETTDALVTVLDRKGRIVRFNRTCESLSGYTFDEAKGRRLFDFLIPPEEVEEVRAVFEDLRAGVFPGTHENYWLTKSGNRRRISWSNTALLDADGNVEFVIGTGLDVTERRLAEVALRDSQARFRLLVESVRDYAIFMLDPDGCVVSWNRGAEWIKGYRAEEIIGQHFSRLYPPEEVVQGKPEEDLRVALSTGRFQEEGWRIRKDGTRFWANILVTAIRTAEGELLGFAKITRDLTERKKLEEQLLQAQKMEAVGRLAGGVAHDFNNILLTVAGRAEQLLARAGGNAPYRRELEEVARAADRGASLTGQLMAFSRREIGQPRVIDLNGVIADLDDLLRRLIGEDIELVTRLAPDLGRMEADPGQIAQVIMNLAVNARDAMPEGGCLTIETSHALAPWLAQTLGPRYVLLTVTDSGAGMDAETREHAFEPFFTTKDPGKGTGLGLSTVYGIVTQCHGEIRTESEVGEGSTFRIYFPEVEGEVEASADVQRRIEESKGGSATILLVEDDDAARALLQEFLEESGFRIVPATNGAEALGIFQARGKSIDLIVTDWVMPTMGGQELVERVHLLSPTTPALYISGYTEKRMPEERLRRKGVRFLHKPFSLRELASTVNSLLAEP